MHQAKRESLLELPVWPKILATPSRLFLSSVRYFFVQFPVPFASFPPSSDGPIACCSVYLSAYLSVCLSLCPPVCLSACMSVRLSVCLPACLPQCLSVNSRQHHPGVASLSADPLSLRSTHCGCPMESRSRRWMFLRGLPDVGKSPGWTCSSRVWRRRQRRQLVTIRHDVTWRRSVNN